MIVPLTVCLLATYAFAKYYSAYGEGKNYKSYATYLPEKLTTAILLAVNTLAYLLFVAVKECTRARSKLGCSINPCCFKEYFVEV